MLLDEGDVASNERFIGVDVANGDVDCNDDGTDDDAIGAFVVFDIDDDVLSMNMKNPNRMCQH